MNDNELADLDNTDPHERDDWITDVDATIHDLMSDDGENDATNDWVHDVACTLWGQVGLRDLARLRELSAEVERLTAIPTVHCVISGDTGTVNLLGPPEAVEAVRNLKMERDRLWDEVERLRAEMADERTEWNVGQDDPHDHYPWTWTPYLDADGGPEVGGIHTPNGPRPDGTTHTYWGVAHEVWMPNGKLICWLVNRWAHERFGTPVADEVRAEMEDDRCHDGTVVHRCCVPDCGHSYTERIRDDNA